MLNEMNDNIDNSFKIESLTDKEIFSQIWTKPRSVFKFINDNNYAKHVKFLLVLAGIIRAFDRAAVKNLGDILPLWAILCLCIILGGLLGWIAYYIYAALIEWTGKWLGGMADTTAILRILAYAMIPAIITLLLLIPQIGVYGNEIFKADGDITSAGLVPNIIVYVSLMFELIFGIWTLILCIVGVSEVQKLSIGKAILNLILPIFVVTLPILLIIWILSGL